LHSAIGVIGNEPLEKVAPPRRGAAPAWEDEQEPIQPEKRGPRFIPYIENRLQLKVNTKNSKFQMVFHDKPS
jgi:hypothetical protein